MTDSLDALRRDGPRRHAAWDAALFDAVAAGPAASLSTALNSSPDGHVAFFGWLRLVEEAIGRGLARSVDPTAGFLERALFGWLPAWLPEMPSADRLAVLARAWNLADGLAREPAWVGRYVAACANAPAGPDDLAAFLVRVLGPVLEPAPPAAWTGPYAVTVVDLRPAHDEFLPGPMWLAAPAVLCVQDRRKPDRQAGVLLRRGGASRLLGPLAGPGEYPGDGPLPSVEAGPNRLTIAGHGVDLPRVGVPVGHRIAPAGFVAVTAVDSQRVWVVESRG